MPLPFGLLVPSRIGAHVKLFHTGVGIRKSLCRLLLRDVIVIFFFFGEVIKTETVLFFFVFLHRKSLLVSNPKLLPKFANQWYVHVSIDTKKPRVLKVEGSFFGVSNAFF